MSKLIFELSNEGCCAYAQMPKRDEATSLNLPEKMLRQGALGLPAVSELQAVRHFTNLSSKNFSIDTHFYPLGSCTMKYNPRGAHKAASLPGFLSRHPLAPDEASQGYMQCAYELQTWLQEITGMQQVSLACMAGAQGEFAGVSMIRAYHHAKGNLHKNEIIVPDAAHGTNPATAVMCGFKVVEVPVQDDGDIDLASIKAAINEKTAGIMLTNPSTLGVFERKILEISKMIHQADGLLYYDGANLNAILGRARPGDMGFDVMHINLHKTFATPHGGGGPGAGPVAAGPRLAEYLPVPMVGKGENGYYWITQTENKHSIGRLSAFMGNAGIILRAHAYALMLGKEGLKRVADYATLNANYLMTRLKAEGFEVTFPDRRASHEFIISFKTVAKVHGVTARDIAKRLLDYGYHAPTTYFPLLVPECFLIEPTETETKAELDGFIDALKSILKEVETDAEMVKLAPHTLPVKRLDEVKAARELDVVFQG